ncbi:hypothetical protein SCHPADRAFT_682323, partial [Schizopora paradoxa]
MLSSCRAVNRFAAGPSSSTFVRSYAVSVKSPREWPGKIAVDEQRVFGERKTFLYNQLTRLIGRGAAQDHARQPLLFLRHKNFRANAMSRLRKEVTTAALPIVLTNSGAPKPSPKDLFSLMDQPPPLEALPQLNVVRTSIFGVALRNYAEFEEKETAMRIASLAGEGGGGGLAVLSLPSLDPQMLSAILRALNRVAPKKKKEDAKDAKGKGAEDDGHIPGRRQKRVRPMLDPELTLLGALIEGRVFGVEGVKDVSNLPSLDTLRAQIVGLLSSPSVQLAMILGEASGGRLARTLEGLKKGLEETQGSSEESTAPW